MSLAKDVLASAFRIEQIVQSRVHGVDFATVPFGSVFSDHMFCAEFENGHWTDGVIRPYGPIPLAPGISALHYGISVFEGLKAHQSPGFSESGSRETVVFRVRPPMQRQTNVFREQSDCGAGQTRLSRTKWQSSGQDRNR
jgi:hypothetical protein